METVTSGLTVDRPMETGGLFGPGHRALSVGMVALISLMAFEALAVATVMPAVARDLDGLALYALAFGGPFASGVVGMVGSGIWSDARGPGRPIRHGTAWFVVGLAVAGTAPSMVLVAAGRIVQGFGAGMLIVALYVVVGRAYPERLRPAVFAAFAAAWVVPSLVGPAIAGLIAEYVGWRWVFLGVPLLAVPATLLVDPVVRGIRPVRSTGRTASASPLDDPVEPDGAVPPAADRMRRLVWASGAAVSAGLLHYGGQQTGALAVALLVPALAGLGICAPRLLPAGFLRAGRGLPTVIALRGLSSAAFAGAEVFIPLLLTRERGFSAALAGFTISTGALAWSLGSWVQGRLRQPASRAALPRLGLTLMVVGIGLLCLLVSARVPIAVGVFGWAVAGLGMGLTQPTLSVLTLELSPPAEQGRNSSALQLGDSLFAATVLAFSGAVLAGADEPGRGTYLAGFVLSTVLALLAALLAGRVVPAGGLVPSGRPR